MYVHASTLDWFSIAPNTIGNMSLAYRIKCKDYCSPGGLEVSSSTEEPLHNILEVAAADVESNEPVSQPSPVLHSLHCLHDVVHGEGRGWRERKRELHNVFILMTYQTELALREFSPIYLVWLWLIKHAHSRLDDHQA